jgi:N-acetyl-alpha-D-glucosaminyl L-malate synthase BshA
VKRVRDVVRVYAKVRERIPSVLVMVGDGPERVGAEQLARELDIDDRVFFLGKIDTVAPLLAGADLFLLPSDRESFGLGALEALASGVPVIGANVGGLPEVVRSGETGFLGPVGDVDAMADAAVELLRDEKRWQQASTLAAADARERFSEAEIVRQYEDFYRYAIDITARRTAKRVSVESPVQAL